MARISTDLPVELHTTSDGSSINDRGAGHRILQRFRHFVRSGRGLNRIPVTLATEQVIPPSSRGSARDRCRDWLCRPRHQSTGDEGFGTVRERISLRNAWHTMSAVVVRSGPIPSDCALTHRSACATTQLRAKSTAARGHRLRTHPVILERCSDLLESTSTKLRYDFIETSCRAVDFDVARLTSSDAQNRAPLAVVIN